MMKKICYILLLSLIAILTACQKYDPGTGPVSRSGDGEVQFAYSVPDYTVLRTPVRRKHGQRYQPAAIRRQRTVPRPFDRY